jgi:hypothetical protein
MELAEADIHLAVIPLDSVVVENIQEMRVHAALEWDNNSISH